MIAVVDYGAGNLHSLCNALEVLAEPYRVAREPGELDDADGILLPGVGHFGQMMRALIASQMASRLQAEATAGKPLLGICLGMQALYDGSEEAPGTNGLGLIRGDVRRFVDMPRIPHMGWNDVIRGGKGDEVFYFAHSYYAPKGEWTTGGCEYGGLTFSAIVQKGNVSGVQFHPEKSGEAGMSLLRDWCRTC